MIAHKRTQTYLACDFETTVFSGQEYTEVWAGAFVELYTEDVKILHSISDTFSAIREYKGTVICYFHNLKFDGAFWLCYFLSELHLKQAAVITNENPLQVEWLKRKEMPNNSFRYSIASAGQWYTITVKIDNRFIEIRDSYKLLPFSLRDIGTSFQTKHQKLDMEYKGYRYAGCEIKPDEKEYIANDVLVLKEALEIMFNEGHSKLTIGSCCLEEFKQTYPQEIYNILFPNLYEKDEQDNYIYALDKEQYGVDNVGEYVRKSYKGGWCYLVPAKKGKHYNGLTADVNSLYPSMMSSESGNYFPVGKPTMWKGNFIPDIALRKDKYFFIRIRTRFYIKDNHLPTVQVKNNLLYKATDWLTTSDVYNHIDEKYYPYYRDIDGNIQDAILTLTLTQTDYQLLLDHYDLVDCEILDGCYFNADIGIFDRYIEKYKKIKLTSKGAIRQLAKLFLNNLYGKLASSPDSSFKIAQLLPDGSLGYTIIKENNKLPGYIPCGSAITSYARNFTIRTAQANYYGENERGFVYADTDSIHCDLQPEELNNVPVHPVNFCCWALESQWDIATFVRQKTYIEHLIKKDGKDVEKPYYDIKCAGLPENCKQLLLKSMQSKTQEEWVQELGSEYYKMPPEEQAFIGKTRTLDDFQDGLKIPSKLRPKNIKGGILLVETTYEMRDKQWKNARQIMDFLKQ